MSGDAAVQDMEKPTWFHWVDVPITGQEEMRRWRLAFMSMQQWLVLHGSLEAYVNKELEHRRRLAAIDEERRVFWEQVRAHRQLVERRAEQRAMAKADAEAAAMAKAAAKAKVKKQAKAAKAKANKAQKRLRA